MNYPRAGPPRRQASSGVVRRHQHADRALNVRFPLTLVVDVGASGIKAVLVNRLGHLVGRRVRQDTPSSRKPDEMIQTMVELTKKVESFVPSPQWSISGIYPRIHRPSGARQLIQPSHPFGCPFTMLSR